MLQISKIVTSLSGDEMEKIVFTLSISKIPKIVSIATISMGQRIAMNALIAQRGIIFITVKILILVVRVPFSKTVLTVQIALHVKISRIKSIVSII